MNRANVCASPFILAPLSVTLDPDAKSIVSIYADKAKLFLGLVYGECHLTLKQLFLFSRCSLVQANF